MSMKTTCGEETRDTTASIDPGQPLQSIGAARQIMFVPMGRHGVFHLRDDVDEPACGADSARMRTESAETAVEIGYGELEACTNCTQPLTERNDRDRNEVKVCKKCGGTYRHLARHLPFCDGRDADELVTDGGRDTTLVGLTGFQRDLLLIIRSLDHASDTVSGQRIKDAVAAHPTMAEPNHGRLYPNLDTLVERGFVEKGQYDRRTNTYQTTAIGRAALRARRDWIDEADEQRVVADGGDGQ